MRRGIRAEYRRDNANHPRAICPNATNRRHVICPNETVGADIYAQLSQAKCVGAVPVCPPERPRSGVSIPKTHAICTRA